MWRQYFQEITHVPLVLWVHSPKWFSEVIFEISWNNILIYLFVLQIRIESNSLEHRWYSTSWYKCLDRHPEQWYLCKRVCNLSFTCWLYFVNINLLFYVLLCCKALILSEVILSIFVSCFPFNVMYYALLFLILMIHFLLHCTRSFGKNSFFLWCINNISKLIITSCIYF